MDSITLNGNTVHIMSPQDFIDLVYEVMGWDSGNYLEQLINDYELEIEDLKEIVEEYQEEYGD